MRRHIWFLHYKSDRLEYLRRRGGRIAEDDWELARDVLRLEVQCGFVFIKELCGKLGITGRFGDLLSYEMAYCAEGLIYRRVFKADENQNFFSYQTAKKLLGNSGRRWKCWRIRRSITGSKHSHGRKQIQVVGIYPYAFLKKGSGVEVLANPLWLIGDKLVASRA